jgi:hypothetical protein
LWSRERRGNKIRSMKGEWKTAGEKEVENDQPEDS